MKAVILAAGPAERLKPFTDTRAKPMIHLAGETILENTLASLKEAGIQDIIIVVNHCRETIETVIGNGRNYGVSIQYVLQDPIDGIGGALRLCESLLEGDAFLLVYGDVLATGAVIETVMSQYMESGGPVAALSLPNSSGDFGNVYLNQDMRIMELVEKPSNPQISNYVFAGIFALHKGFFQLLEEHQNNMEQCFQARIQQGALSGAIWEGGWIDIRRPWDILEGNRMLMNEWDSAQIHKSVQREPNVHIEGPVHIEEGVTIGAGSVLKGPCFIGKNSYIGNNVLIRQYTSLGPRSVVGYGTELKNCVLFGNSTLGRLSFIGDSVIGENTLLGTGVTTVNFHMDETEVEMPIEEGLISTGMKKLGAFIGDNVQIGARNVLAPGTVVKSGEKIPDLITLANKPQGN